MFTPEEIKLYLKKLMILKRSGELDAEEKLLSPKDDDCLWRDSITYDSLESYVQHRDEEIKLNTLALIVESKKSTLKFTSKELDIIILFLRVNLKEKFEFIPLVKKALKRMKDSLVVMRRQCIQEEKMRNYYRKNCDSLEFKQEVLDRSCRISCNLKRDIDVYCNTFQTLRNMCMCGPDATYCRRQSSLRILLLMKDLLDGEFELVTWNAEQVEVLFRLLLLDTYESNKEMAFNIIKSTDPSLLRLDIESNVRDIITVAIRLGSSIRPIDSVTAAYILKVGMLSPILPNVLETWFGLMRYSRNIVETIILHLISILLQKLKESLILARENVVMTFTEYSVYGYLFCIRSLLQECDVQNAEKEYLWQDIVSELVCVCFEFSSLVSTIVSNSSPEGHLPMDLNLQAVHKLCDLSSKEQMITPQMVLLCSWRTVKEVSLLFGFLATNASIREHHSCIGLLNEEQICRIGEHLVTLLIDTKHRGAFEQAYVGFSQLCTRLWRLDKKRLNELPKMWLHHILIAITGIKEERTKLCATRRSAGVPFMIQALLSTEPRQHKDTKTTIFHSVMKILLGFAQLENINPWKNIRELMYKNSVFSEYENTVESLQYNHDYYVDGSSIPMTEIKIHALNILRAVFRHSHLADVVNNYVADGLIVAVKSYDALTWAERNAATLLFSSLIIRIFGVQRTKDHVNLTTDNKMNYRFFFEKYPCLLPFILNKLQTSVVMHDNIIKSSVQSILLLLSRLYHNRGSESTNIQWKINDLTTLVIQCGKSAIYETRKLAARALVALLTEQSVVDVLKELVENVISTEENHPRPLNLIHGYMLQILEILTYFDFEEFQSFNIDWERFSKKTIWILQDLERGNSNSPCFLLATLYINICHKIYKTNKMYTKHPLLYTLVSHLTQQKKLKQGPAQEDYKLSAVNFIRSVAKETTLLPQCVSIRVYFHGLINSETQIVAWSSITDIINEIDSRISVLLLKYSVNLISNFIQEFHRYNPELQDAMLNFLYNSLVNFKQFESSSMEKLNICKFVLNGIRLNDNKSIYCARGSYLRLLGKSYVTLASFDNGAEEISEECVADVYNNFCDNEWIASLSKDFRTSVFCVMQDLFSVRCKYNEHRFVQIQWWTTVLQLLMDNNREIRHEAFTLIEHIPVHCSSSKKLSYLNLFLTKFYKYMHRKDSELICVVLFYWSISLLDVADYEMDETDVFDKCTSYDFFEPVEVSKACVKFLIERMECFIDNVLSDDIIDWINDRTNVVFAKSISFRRLVKDYENRIPTIDNKLHDVLDRTYKKKLLEILTYEQFKIVL